MKISIIVPVYNVENYVERCVNSVISQTYSGQIECIIVDDYTPDKSISKIENILSLYKGPIVFKIIHHSKNLGLSAARNTGIKNATGDYVYFLDSDDEITSDCIEILCKPLQKRDYDFVIANYRLDKEENTAYVIPISNGGYYKNIQKMFCLHHWPSMAWNKLCNLKFLRDNNLYFQEGLIHEDILWSFFLAIKTKSFYVCSEITYIYCYRENSIVNEVGQNQRHLDVFLQILDKMKISTCNESEFLRTFAYCHMNDVLLYSLKHYASMNKSLFDEYYIKYKKCLGKNIFGILYSFHIDVKYPIKLFHLLCPNKFGKSLVSKFI